MHIWKIFTAGSEKSEIFSFQIMQIFLENIHLPGDDNKNMGKSFLWGAQINMSNFSFFICNCIVL